MRPPGGARSAPANFRSLEPDLNPENFFDPTGNDAGRDVEPFRHFDPVQIHDRVEAALGKYVDQHRERRGVFQKCVLGIDVGGAGNRMALHDREDFLGNESHHLTEEFRLAEFIAVQPFDQLLAGVNDDFIGHGHIAETVHGARIELESALVIELLEDVLFDFVQRALGVDEVIVEGLLERLERVPRLVLETYSSWSIHYYFE